MENAESLQERLIREETERINKEFRDSTARHLSDAHDRYNTEHTLWGLETIKHIALVGLAGLGGAFALISSNGLTKQQAFYPAVLFAVSSFCCMFCMYFAMKWRDYYMKHQNYLLRKVYDYDFPKPEEYGQPRKVTYIGYIADSFGWTAAGSVIAGGILLFQALA